MSAPAGVPLPLVVEPMRPEDWPAVRSIYEAGIATGNATFETKAPSWPEWDRAHLERPRLVARTGEAGPAPESRSVVGWAAVVPVSGRCVYGGVVDLSVYVAPEAQGRGVGRALLAALMGASEEAGLWTLQAGIFPENTASLALHRSLGFREVGTREKMGKMNGRWRDVLLLERRSRKVGIE
ncbi:MAG TPA: GNAT family N-acetyltransferase [Candidatus Polarisedimenticolia bacterium]|nr:GNAT family N-acetyltransferase [Candidatus Polarisedimenticolia bacterium]